MKQIFEKPSVRGLDMENRLVRSATWMALADDEGRFGDDLVATYEELAAGGVGAIITGFTSVADWDHAFDGIARISNECLVEQHARLVDAVHAHGTPILAQLALGAYFRDGREVPIDVMTVEEVQGVVSLFGQAARRAAEAGYDGVQIHLAHFFFLSRFLSPAVNHRTDAYGGSNENRARIALEILAAVREAAPDLHVSAKVNCSDFTPGGLEPEDALEICVLLDAAGIDSIEVSGNGTSRQGVRAGLGEGYFAPFAKVLAGIVEAPLIVVGGWRSREAMEAALESTGAEMLSLSRPLVREPDLPRRMRDGEASESACVSCNACYGTPGHACIFNLRQQR